MNRKRFPALALVIALVLALTACAGGGAPSAPDASPSSGAAASPQASEEAESPAESPAASGEAKNLKVLMANQPTDPNEEPPHEKIRELTGYNLECFMLPAERPEEKLNLEIASGVSYDILMLNPLQFRSLAGKNALIAIDELMEEYGPNVKAAVTPDEWSAASIDGVTYGVPGFDAEYIGGGLAVNVDMLTAAGVEFKNEMTVAEFRAMLEALQAAHPDATPMTGNSGFSYGIGAAFNVVEHDFALIDGQPINKVENPRLREYVEYMRELYDAKLIDPEWPTNTGEVVNEKFSAGRAAVAWMGWWNADTINEAVKTNTGSEVEYIHPLFDDSGNSHFAVKNGVTGFRAIPRSSEQPEEVMKFWNLFSDPDIFPTIFIGEEGVHHEVRMDSDGNPSYWPIFPAFTQWFNGHYFTQVAPSDTYTTLWLCRVRKSEVLYDAFERMNTYGSEHYAMDALAYAPPMDAITKYSQSLHTLANDNLVEFIAGTKSMDEWDSFLAKWQEEGGQEVLADVAGYYA